MDGGRQIKSEPDILEVNIIEDEDDEYYMLPRPEDQWTKDKLKLRSILKLSRSSTVVTTTATGLNVPVEDWPGECQFRIDRKSLCLASEKEKASDATYSTLLDKLYCDMNKCFSIRFYLLNPKVPYEELSIRAIMVYTSPGDLNFPVTRCPNHLNPGDSINLTVTDDNQIESVLWSNGLYAKYEKNDISGRLSLIEPFGIPHVGSDHVTHVFKFTCIGSCVGGINRRATTVVFSLEHNNVVIGRQTLSCRICSCPKRDKRAQESAFMRQSIANQASLMSKMYKQQQQPPKIAKAPSPLSKISKEAPDLFVVPIWGYENYVALRKYAEYLDSTSGAMNEEDYRTRRAQIIHEQEEQSHFPKRTRKDHDDAVATDAVVCDLTTRK